MKLGSQVVNKIAKKNIIVAGSEGEWGGVISAQLKNSDDYKVKDFDIKNFFVIDVKKHYDCVIVATPPDQHAEACHTIINAGVKAQKFLIDKPNPPQELDELRQLAAQQPITIKFVDHYLYKDAFRQAENWFKKNLTCVESVEVYICETALEMRDWMIDGANGGVIKDLAHHAVAVVDRLFSSTEIEGNWCDFKLNAYSTFNRNFAATENYIDADGVAYGKSCRIVVGKQCSFDNKSIVFNCFDGRKKIFTLAGKTTYVDVASDEGSGHRLGFDQVQSINVVLDMLTLLVIEKKRIECRDREAPGDLLMADSQKTANQVYVELLAEMFRHRHLYYWGTYYKLSIYFLVMIISPYIAYYYLKDVVPSSGFIIVITAPVVAISVLLMVRHLKDFLISEDVRLVVVHKRYKELFRSVGISLEPKKPEGAGVGNHMSTVLTKLLKRYKKLFRWVGISLVPKKPEGAGVGNHMLTVLTSFLRTFIILYVCVLFLYVVIIYCRIEKCDSEICCYLSDLIELFI